MLSQIKSLIQLKIGWNNAKAKNSPFICNALHRFQSLGLARTAEVQRDARIGEADANMSTVIKQAIASEELLKSKLANDTEIARFWSVIFTTYLFRFLNDHFNY